MGRLARMVRQFPSSLPQCLIMYFDCYQCEYYYFYFYSMLTTLFNPPSFFCNRSENGINLKNYYFLTHLHPHMVSGERCKTMTSGASQ